MKRRIVLGLVATAAFAAALAGVAQLFWHARLFAGRVAFPLDLEWMEGGMLLHAKRIAEGQPIYVPPSLDFIPFLYTPFYPAVLAALSKIFGLGYLLGRMVSVLSFAATLALVVVSATRTLVATSRPGRAAALAVGLGGAGVIASSFDFAGAFYDLVRSDSLLILLEGAALFLAIEGKGKRSAGLAGVAIALAFFTKQTAAFVGVAIGAALLVTRWRRGLVFGAVAALVLALGAGWLNKSSGGWFWKYIYQLHQSHAFLADRAYDYTPKLILRSYGFLFGALGLATAGLALARQLRRTDVVLWAAAVAGFFAACKGFGTQWAWPNAFIPGVVFPAYAATVLVARLCAHGLASASLPAAVLASAAAAALAVQCVKVGAPLASSFVPTPGDRAAAMRHLDLLRALPGDGFIPFHPYYSVLVGKRPFAHRMGVKDVEALLGRPAGLDQAVAAQRFPFVVLDDKVQPYEFPHMDARYHVVEEIYAGAASVRMFSGAPTSPRYILLPTVDPPALPPGGLRLFDFEAGGFTGFTVDGDAFGASPAPARTGAYGRFAADSARFGPVALGTLRSPPIAIHKPHLRFTLTGPPDANLRVALVNGPDLAASVGPDGTTRVVDLDVSGLMGRSVILQIEDRSTTAGLCVDEIAAW